MEVGNVGSRPNYNATKKGTMAGALCGAVASAGWCGVVHASTLPLKMNSSIGAKKSFINQFSKQYSKLGIDMAKTTVSRVIKSAKVAVKSPVVVSMTVAGAALLGAGIGFVTDLVKNATSKKVEKTENV